MTATTVPAPRSFRELAVAFPGWARQRLPKVIAASVSAGVLGYIANVWIMAVRYEGTADVPAGSPVTNSGNYLGGALFWALASSVVFGVIGYRQAAGRERFWREARALPRTLAGLVRRDGHAGRVHLLWGAAAAMAAGLVVPPALGAVSAVAVLATAPTVLGSIIATSLSRAWSSAVRPLGPSLPRPPGMESMVVGLIGGAIALTAGMVLPSRSFRLALAIGLAALAVVIGRQVRPPAAAAAILLVVMAAAAVDVVLAHRAAADDGSFAECNYNWSEWLRRCGGADRIRRDGLIGAIAAALGAPLGAFIGGLLGSIPPGGWDGGDGFVPGWDDPFQLPPDVHDPIVEFRSRPAVWVSGGSIMVRAANGTIIAAPLAPNGELAGPWQYAGEDSGPSAEPTARAPSDEPPPVEAVPSPAGDGDALEAAIEEWLTQLAASLTTDELDPFGEEPGDEEEPGPSRLPSAEELAQRFEGINNWNWTAVNSPELANRLDHFWETVRSRPFDESMLHELEGIEAMEAQLSGARHDAIVQDQEAFGNRALAEANARLRAEGYRTPEQIAADTRVAQQIADALARNETYVMNHLGDLPEGQQEATIRILEQTDSRIQELLAQGRPVDPATIDIIRRLTGSVWNTTQGSAMAESAAAQIDAANAQLGENLSRAAQAGLTGGVAAGAVLMGVGLAPMGMSGAQLGASMWGFGVTTGAAEGYGSGESYGGREFHGPEAALLGAARNALPVNLVSQIAEELNRTDSSSGLAIGGRILLSTVRDIGNVAGLGDAAGVVGELGQTASTVRSGLATAGRQPVPPPGGLTAVDEAFAANQARGQQMAETFDNAVQNLRAAEASGDAAAIAAARDALQQQAVHVASDYNARAVLKGTSKSLQGAYTEAMEPVFQQTTQQMVDQLNADGWRIGGRAVRTEDFVDLRNAATRGTVPMDRDLALNQMRVRDLQAQLEAIPSRVEPGSVDAFTRDYLQDQIAKLQQQTQLTFREVPVTPVDANKALQDAYNNAYRNVTQGIVGGEGYSAASAMGTATQAQHGEAYHDLNMILNQLDVPLVPAWADQSGSVTPFKAYENFHNPATLEGLGSTPASQQANAVIETARGTLKDIDSKLGPRMIQAGADPAALARMTQVRDFLRDVSQGKYYPSQAQALSQQLFNTDITGLSEQVGSNLAAVIQNGVL